MILDALIAVAIAIVVLAFFVFVVAVLMFFAEWIFAVLDRWRRRR